MQKYRFYKKDYNGKSRWWVDIKPWIFPKRLLIMYSSAEAWLEKVGEGRSDIMISTATREFTDAEVLYREKSDGVLRGTWYVAKSYKRSPTEHRVLLCPVTLYVFGRYPKAIYYRVHPEGTHPQ